MTEPYLNQNLTHETVSSPGGFWPDPDKEGFYRNDNHPWEVPRKRKPRGSKESYYYFDMTTGETVMNRRKIPEDQNRFALLDPDFEENPPVCSYRLDSGDTLFQSYDNLFYNINARFDVPDCYTCFVKSNKINVCSGYFVDFISLDDVNNYDNYNDTKGVEFYKYNPLTKSNLHLKQLASSESKYNIKYFKN